jgi:hypothetical protein
MKKSLLATTFVAFPLSANTTRLRNYGCIAIVLLAGCTATQVRWDATKMRKDVMVYYNDQIMDNLIRAKQHLPFVHVDITLLTSSGGSQISGTIGAGETRTNANTSNLMAGMLGTITNAVMRPFTYSVSPQQTESLTISAAPALGPQALASPAPSSIMEATKRTETVGKENSTATEFTAVKPTTTIYELYQNFADCYVKDSPTLPSKGEYVPDTLKRWGGEYYYIPVGNWKCSDCRKRTDKDKEDNQQAYYKFCIALFTKGQAGSLEKALQQTQATSLAAPTR